MTKLLYNSRQVVVRTIKKIKSESIQISEITKAHVLCKLQTSDTWKWTTPFNRFHTNQTICIYVDSFWAQI